MRAVINNQKIKYHKDLSVHEIRPYRPGEEEEILDLLRTVFGRWPNYDIDSTPRDFWDWKFRDNPIDETIVIVAAHEGKIVGCLQNFPKMVKIGDKIVKSGDALDAAVHPDHRGQGLYRKMLDLMDRIREDNGTYLVISISTNPILLASARRRGRPELPLVRKYIYIENINLHLKWRPVENRVIKQAGYLILKTLNKSKTKLTTKIHREKDIQLEELSHFDHRIDLFWEKVKKEYYFTLDRNRDFLNWRYCDGRNRKYRIWTANQGNQIVGYCIIRINKINPEYHEGYIVDLLTLPNRLDAAYNLLHKSMEFFKENKVNLISAFVIAGSQNERAYKEVGFIDSRTENVVGLEYYHQAGKKDIESLNDISPLNIDYQLCNTDWI